MRNSKMRLILLATICFSILVQPFPLQAKLLSQKIGLPELSKEQKWVITGAGRTIYLSKIDGSEKEVLFNSVGDKDATIGYLSCSYDGKKILLSMVDSEKVNSLWFVDIDTNSQRMIYSNANIPIRYQSISNDGKKIIFSANDIAYLVNNDGTELTDLGYKTHESSYCPEFSYDGKFIVYASYKIPNFVMCIWDVEKKISKQLTSPREGNFFNSSFCYDSNYILTPRKVVGASTYSLWMYDQAKKEFKLMAEAKDKNIYHSLIDRYNNVITFCSSDDKNIREFWSLSIKDNKLLKLSAPVKGESFGQKLSFEGKFLIYSTSESTVYLAKTDASFNEELAKIVDIPGLYGASWYNHPPFPPEVTTIMNTESNQITWKPTKLGSFPIGGYRIYRSSFKGKKDYELLTTVPETVNQFLDTTCDLKESYYYLVRCYDIDGTESIPSNEVIIDKSSPSISFTNPSPHSWLNQEKFKLEGLAQDLESGVDKVMIDGNLAILANDGRFTMNYTLKIEGENLISGTVYDKSGNTAKASLLLNLDSALPLIDVVFPSDNTELFAKDSHAKGKITDTGSGLQSISLNSQPLSLDVDGSFLVPIKILPGSNVYTFDATDKVGNTTQKIIHVKGMEQIIVQLTIGSNRIIVNNKEVTIDAPPFIHSQSNRTLVPARFVVEPFGGSISYDNTEQKVTILRDENKIELWIGKNIAIVNGKDVPIDSIPSLAPIIVKSRTFLPLRFVSENVGFKVVWDPIKHVIRLEFPNPDRQMGG
jgi:hypothetical protein